MDLVRVGEFVLAYPKPYKSHVYSLYRVREICQHEFTHANEIILWLTSGAHSSKSDGLLSECTETCRSGLHSTLRSLV